MSPVMYRPGIGRYLDEDRRWYVVEDANGHVFLILRAGMRIGNGTLGRHSSGDLMLVRSHAAVGGGVILTDGRTGEWAQGAVQNVFSIFQRATGQFAARRVTPAAEQRRVSREAMAVIQQLTRGYIIMRGPRSNLVFGAFVDNVMHWDTLENLPHPSARFQEIVNGPERPAIVTRLLHAAHVTAASAPCYPRHKGERAVLVDGVWYRVCPDGTQQRVTSRDEAVVVNLAEFNSGLTPLGGNLADIKDVRSALMAGDEVMFPVEGWPEGTVLVPWHEDRPHHLVLAANTTEGRGVAGITLVRPPDGGLQPQPYVGPWQPDYFLCSDGTVLVLPS